MEDIHFDCGDIVQHFSQAMLDFWNDDARRTCKNCGKKVEQPGPTKPFSIMANLAEPPSPASESPVATGVQPPIDLNNWIEENRHLFKPPVSNRYIYDGRDFFVMIIMGPNARNDFHQVDSEEFFYQLKGDIKVRIRERDRIVDHLVREGETFFIPPNVPHAPVRPPNTLGLVVERRRPPGETEHVIFYCENCEALVEDIHFDCGDIVQHFSQAMLDFWNDDARRTCKNCGKKVEQPGPTKPF